MERSEKKELWRIWLAEFQLLLLTDGKNSPPKKAYLYGCLAELFGVKDKHVEKLCLGDESETDLLRILGAIPNLYEKLLSLNEKRKWGLTPEGLERMRLELFPKLACICRESLGLPPRDVYRLLDHHENDVDGLSLQWAKASVVAMVQINGALFREARLKWQGREPKARWMPSSISNESKLERRSRIDWELEGDEPWSPSLTEFRAFIPSDEAWETWLEASGTGRDESPVAFKHFWTGYAEKLMDRSVEERQKNPRRKGLLAEVYELTRLDFLAHCFDYDRQGGYIVGTHLLYGNPAPLAFEVSWPLGEQLPSQFHCFQKAIDQLKDHSTLIFPKG